MFGLQHGTPFRHATAESYTQTKEGSGSSGESSIALVNLQDGTMARIVKIGGDARTVARLESMGLHPGCLVSRKSQALNGGPVVVELGSTQLALGAALAARIQVRADNEG